MATNPGNSPYPIALVLTLQDPRAGHVDYIADLISQTDFLLIIVNDGHSKAEFEKVFQGVNGNRRVEILHHAVPLGEDRALRTGINHFLVHYSDSYLGILFYNLNDFYSTSDVIRVAQALRENRETLCLGVAQAKYPRFTSPWAGQKLAGYAFRLTTGYVFSDFQSSLMGIPTRYLQFLLSKKEENQGAKLDLLIHTTKYRHPIYEVPISSVAENALRFNPLRDSIKISFVFLRFIVLSSMTALIDYLVFVISMWLSGDILLSMILARCVAGTYNFSFGGRWVFRSTQHPVRRALKYALLVVVLMFISYGLLTPMVTYLGLSPYLSKILAEGAVFLLSFAAQSIFVYSPESAAVEKSDWTNYYNSPFPTSTWTRRLTEALLLRVIRKYHPAPIHEIREFGGANSCFYAGFRKQYPLARYIIVDNNQRGLDLFHQQHPGEQNAFLENQDILSLSASPSSADVVFSVGLIEHFTPRDTAQAIRAHFEAARPGALVILAYPTPTLLYRIARRIAELLRLWSFPDERPLTRREVTNEAQKYGEIVYSTIHWGVIFTQAVTAVIAADPEDAV
jgi:putative flippase GtrA